MVVANKLLLIEPRIALTLYFFMKSQGLRLSDSQTYRLALLFFPLGQELSDDLWNLMRQQTPNISDDLELMTK